MAPAVDGQLTLNTPGRAYLPAACAQRLKRVFGIQIDLCGRCGGQLQVIARVLAHLQKTAPEQHQAELPLGARAPSTQASGRRVRVHQKTRSVQQMAQPAHARGGLNFLCTIHLVGRQVSGQTTRSTPSSEWSPPGNARLDHPAAARFCPAGLH
jgi:hypothetical protein